MKKPILFFLKMFFLATPGMLMSQAEKNPALTAFDFVFDRFGNKYDINALRIGAPGGIHGPVKAAGANGKGYSNTQIASISTSCSAGYFDLYFDPSASNPFMYVPQAQNVLCQVFRDISAFIYSPLSYTPTERINIYCGLSTSPNLLAQAGSFYAFPANATNPNQGIIDGLVYKKLTTGIEPYLSIPLNYSVSGPAPNPNNFYHGCVLLTGTITLGAYNTTLSLPPASSQFDLYSIFLHEATHALGFGSLIGSNGISTFGAANNLYSRYDGFLRDNSGNPLLVNSSSVSCNQSNLTLPLVSAVNPLNCVNPGAQVDITGCPSAAQFISPNVNVKVYTPNCFELGSSLSHFEDMCATSSYTPSNPSICTPNPPTPGFNNLYFTMSNYTDQGSCYMKRFLKNEERMALCDLGYSLTSVYSNSISTTLIDGASNSHVYLASCSHPLVYGVNDGLVNNAYTFNTNTSIFSTPLANILGNDYPSNMTITCAPEVVYNNTTINAAASILLGNLVVTATAGSGLVIVKYYPQTLGGVFGNATYVFIQFLPAGCNIPGNCDMVQNGGFENIDVTVTPTCGALGATVPSTAIGCWAPAEGNPYLYSRGCTSGTNFNLGVNTLGSSPAVMNSFNGAGNDRIIGLNYNANGSTATQAMKNNLASPLIPGVSYNLSFMVANVPSSVSGNNTVNSPVVITVASDVVFSNTSTSPYPGALNVIKQFTVPAGANWQHINYAFTFSSPGNANHSSLLIGINSVNTMAQGYLTTSPATGVWCYIDQLSLLPAPSLSLTTNNYTICGNQGVYNLGNLFPGVNGTFSGTGVTYNNGQYDFNTTSTLSPGPYAVAFTYTTTGGCVNTVYDFITVSTNTNYLVLNPSYCASNFSVNLPSLLLNPSFIPGTVFSVNGTTANPIVPYPFSSPGAYTITASNSNPGMCNYLPVTAVVMAYTVPPVATIYAGAFPATSTLYCTGNPAVNLFAFSNPSVNFLWQPGNIAGANVYVAPTSNVQYTLISYYGSSSSCYTTQTFEVMTSTNCCTQTLTPLTATNITANLTGPQLILHDITVTGSGNPIVFSSDEFLMGPNVKITVSPGTEFRLIGCHLHACGNKMWQGVVVSNGANIVSVGQTLFEDAITGIDLSNITPAHLNIPIEVSNTIFNKNYVSINISNSNGITTLPIYLSENVFTSRSLTATSTSWPTTFATGTGLRAEGATTPSTGLVAPYPLNSFPISNLLLPYTSQPGHIGIQINNINNSSGAAPSAGVSFGSTLPNTFNLFDALGEGIDITNASLSASNNVFQNMQYYLVGSNMFGGTGIRHNITSLMNAGLYLTPLPNNASNSYGNRFWECYKGIDATNVYEFTFEYGLMRSTQQSGNIGNFMPGNTGISLATNRFNYNMNFNDFNNIERPVNIPISSGSYFIGSAQTGIYTGKLNITQNYFGPQVNSSNPTSNLEYLYNAITVSGPNAATWQMVPGTSLAITSNKINRGFRGVSLSGMAGFPSTVSGNIINLVNDVAPNPQYGIQIIQTQNNVTVNSNTLTGTIPFTNNLMTLVSIVNNGGSVSPVITCNNLKSCYNGFEFKSSSAGAAWKGNIMASLVRGLVLSSGGIMGPQGTMSNPNDNQWSSGITNGTYVDGSSNAGLSKLTVKNGVFKPVNNIGNPGADYASPANLITTTTINSYTCSASGLPLPPSYKSANETTGISENNNEAVEEAISIFPNPSSGKINITSERAESALNIKVMDVSGKTVFEKTLKLSNRGADLELMADEGIYFIEIRGENDHYITTKKIVISK